MGVSHCDAAIDAMISCAEAKVIQAAQPKHVSKHVSITVDPGKHWTEIDGVLIDSRDLACKAIQPYRCAYGSGHPGCCGRLY